MTAGKKRHVALRVVSHARHSQHFRIEGMSRLHIADVQDDVSDLVDLRRHNSALLCALVRLRHLLQSLKP